MQAAAALQGWTQGGRCRLQERRWPGIGAAHGVWEADIHTDGRSVAGFRTSRDQTVERSTQQDRGPALAITPESGLGPILLRNQSAK
jgi:hypothetical protein